MPVHSFATLYLRVRQQAQGHGPSAEITSEYRVHRVQVTRSTPVRPWSQLRLRREDGTSDLLHRWLIAHRTVTATASSSTAGATTPALGSSLFSSFRLKSQMRLWRTGIQTGKGRGRPARANLALQFADQPSGRSADNLNPRTRSKPTKPPTDQSSTEPPETERYHRPLTG